MTAPSRTLASESGVRRLHFFCRFPAIQLQNRRHQEAFHAIHPATGASR